MDPGDDIIGKDQHSTSFVIWDVKYRSNIDDQHRNLTMNNKDPGDDTIGKERLFLVFCFGVAFFCVILNSFGPFKLFLALNEIWIFIHLCNIFLWVGSTNWVQQIFWVLCYFTQPRGFKLTCSTSYLELMTDLSCWQ